MTPDESSAVIVYMGTRHPRMGEEGFGEDGGGQESGFGDITDERIYSWRVDQ